MTTRDKQLSANQNYKNREELSELLRVLSKASNHGSEEHKQLEIKAEKMLNKFGCFFPVSKMPIYQDIISGDFMRRAEANKLLATAKQLKCN